MSSTCILTDSSVQFSRHSFTGRNLIFQVPFHIKVGRVDIENDPVYKVSSLPAQVTKENGPTLSPPTMQECMEAIALHGQTYNEILAIFMSSHLSEAFQNMEKASRSRRGKVAVSIIDSQTTSVGLGSLVQFAADQAARGSKLVEIEQNIRGKIPRIYSQFCISNLSYLERSGFISKPQSMLGEMLSILPVFSFDEGKLISTEKVKSYRHLAENFQEFVDEFSDLEQVCLVQSQPPMLHETHTLREHVINTYSGTPFCEIPINLTTAALLGPSAVGIYAIEGKNHH